MSTEEMKSKWPNGARAALCVTMDNMGEAADLDRGLWPADELIGNHYSVTEVLPKMLELLKKYDIHATYFIEAWNLNVYPDTIANDILDAGHEVAWHAWRHEAWSKLTDFKDEEANFKRSFGRMKQDQLLGGQSPHRVPQYKGFRPPGGVIHGERTLKLCRTFGLEYISPAGQDAAVVSIDEGRDRIVVLPFRWCTVDAYYYMDSFSGLRKIKGVLPEDTQGPDVLTKSMMSENDSVIEEGGYLSVLFHPFLTDRPERLQAMESVIQYLFAKRDSGEIWLAKCEDVQKWLNEHSQVVGDDPGWDQTQWR